MFNRFRNTKTCLLIFILLAATLFIAGCTGVQGEETPVETGAQGELIVYTAASLTGVSADLGSEFEKRYPGTKITFNLAGTQTIKNQIQMGAYADVFMSASTRYTNELMGGGYLVNDTVRKFTSNYIVIIVPSGNPGDIHSYTDLTRPGVKIAMGTEEVPVGINTRIVLDKLSASPDTPDGWKDAVFQNVVTYETTEPGVVTKVGLGEVDAGFVYESSFSAAKTGSLELIPIPEEYNALQIYTLGILTDSTNKKTGETFIEFILSDEGQKILKDYGFTSITTT
ncbi:molybdate ABC transporter substrate-binding protein [Methanocalculus taiwanensis]|uniref:Molybdate ABC transporter substrate-binding protein n=1 Tax=Methanocalculus taiwanensis TaxID=106207 RepID=A0ABD4TL42_9EURY|nr:molybdate ABC transporter substrate-binding protein [Methanocalculus taiwanensis]MCQ1539476.1 molybdate ABC transporter substrate-binding protein [Methanocalculus taiwanensis]